MVVNWKIKQVIANIKDNKIYNYYLTTYIIYGSILVCVFSQTY